MRSSEALCRTPLFQHHTSTECFRKQAESSYLRAQAIGRLYDLTSEDVLTMSPKFWDMHTDPILTRDTAAATLLTIQYNLAAGTIAKFTSERNDLVALLDNILNFDTIGQFCLTEVGHGLDVFNMETTATLLGDGCFDLHTPNDGAAKFMPPTVPVLGLPCVAVIFAQLVVAGQKHGIKPFLVPINDGFNMCEGITAKLLPYRGGAAAINHSATSFHHVRLSSQALLGDTEKSETPHQDFLMSIWRISVGAMALGSTAIPALQVSSYITLQYSLRRQIRNHDGSSVPILSFRTQQLPVFMVMAQSFVLQAFHRYAVGAFTNEDNDPRVRHGISTCFKAVMIQHCQSSLLALSDRCGAQGLFPHNQMSELHAAIRGIAIAEGDILVLSIRLATELLLERYSIPSSTHPGSLLCMHEESLITEYRNFMRKNGGHRSPKFTSHLLPRCQAIVEAIGHRMAYDAAVDSAVPQSLIDLYVCDVVKLDVGWYIENKLLTRSDILDMEDAAITSMKPSIRRWAEEMDVAAYVTAPIVSDESWNLFFGRLENYGGPHGQYQARL